MEECFILHPEQNPFYSKIFLFFRYIDDCFCVFNDPTSLNQFLDWLNQVHPSIFFTYEGSISQVHFLDTIVFRDSNNMLAVKPYNKPTDRNNYLHFGSFHSRNLRCNIPYGQFLQLRRNATNETDYRKHATRMHLQFKECGYPTGIVDAAYTQATRVIVCESLFVSKESSRPPGLTWALDYTPKTSAILNLLRKHWHLLEDIPTVKPSHESG